MQVEKSEEKKSGIRKNNEVSSETSNRMAEILADSPITIKLSNKEVKIRSLRVYTKYKIYEVYNKIKATESDIESIIKEAATNLLYSAEIIAIILCNDKFTTDLDANEQMIESKTLEIMLDKDIDESEWAIIVLKAMQSLDVSSVFQITALIKAMTASLRGRKEMIVGMNQEI